jgi:hypothetical protein
MTTPALRVSGFKVLPEDTSYFIPVGDTRFVTANELYLKVQNE